MASGMNWKFGRWKLDAKPFRSHFRPKDPILSFKDVDLWSLSVPNPKLQKVHFCDLPAKKIHFSKVVQILHLDRPETMKRATEPKSEEDIKFLLHKTRLVESVFLPYGF